MSRKQFESATTIVANPRFSPSAGAGPRPMTAQPEDAGALLRSRTTSVDQTVTHAFRTGLSTVFPHGMALVAVGGYGRRELFPYSDIDLLVLVDKEIQSEEQRQALSVFLAPALGREPAAEPVSTEHRPSARASIRTTSNWQSAFSMRDFLSVTAPCSSSSRKNFRNISVPIGRASRKSSAR